MKYWFDPKMKWKTFKMLNDKFCHDSGPTPKEGDRILWEMLKERKINILLDTKCVDDPIIITLKNPPKKSKIII